MLGLHGKPLGRSSSASPNEKIELPKTNPNGHHLQESKSLMPRSVNGSMLPRVHSEAFSMAFTSEERTVEAVVLNARTRLIAEVESVDDALLDEMTIESFIDFLNKERLTSMPHRGSRWDRALRSAEYFALQISSYADLLEQFTPGGFDGVHIGLSSCYLLLQLGQAQDKALEPSFAVLYRIGLSLRFLIKHGGFFANQAIQFELQQAFCTLLQLVSETALLYHAKISTMSGKRATFDFFGTFGKTINQFHHHKDRIADLMWSFALRSDRINTSVDVIRQFLEPGDTVLKQLASDQFATKTKRAEFTCEWFQSPLLEFLRSSDQTLAITGPSGSGKTVLASWIEERLQRPLARKSYETVEYRFESDLPTEATSLACVKSLLLQLLHQNVGDGRLFSKLVSAHAAFISSGHDIELEEALWEAIDLALDAYKDGDTKLIIIVDGLEQVAEKSSLATNIAHKIHGLVNRHVCVRAIILSEANHTANAKKTREFHLSASRVKDDIYRMAQDILQRDHHFRGLGKDQQKGACDIVVNKSNGSFLYVELVCRYMLLEDTPKDFSRIAEEMPKGTSDLFKRFMSKHYLEQADVKRVLTWILAAQRPLKISELSELLRVDLQHQILSDKRPDARGLIRERFKLFLTVDSRSIVRIRHGAVRQHLLSVMSKGDLLLPRQDAQKDLLLRLLLYSKHCFHEEEPSFDMPPLREIDDACRRHALLGYCITYWLAHFRQTSMFHGNSLKISSDLKAVFPLSTRMILFEWSRWTASLTVRGALELHELCLRLRREVFGEKHAVTVQSLVVLGSIRHRCNQHREAASLMLQASQIAQAVFTQYHNIALKCSLMLLTVTESVSDITRTEIITRREQTLKYVIAAYKYHEESELVVQYTKVLFQLYIQIQENESATRVYKELYEIVLKYYGRHSEELAEIERLMIVLQRDTKQEQIGSWTDEPISGTSIDDFDIVVDIKQIEVTIRIAESHEAEGRLLLAEEILVTLWSRVVETSHEETSFEVQVAKIDCALAYVKFLRRFKRHEEATAILICLWAEYEQKMETINAEIIVIRIKMVGELMRSFGLFSAAVSVFTKVWSYFKRTEKTTHEVAQATTTLITETVEEVTRQQSIRETNSETTATTTTLTTATTEESRTMIREMFKSRVSSCKSASEYRSVLTSCAALVAIHRQEKRYHEAITTINTSLEVVWKALIIGIGMISLPETCSVEAIRIAIQLAECYVEEHRLEEAEKIYVRIYQACRFSLHIEDKQVTIAVGRLISFYESIHRHEKTIEVYSDIIDCYRRQLGVRHSMTIKTLYTFSNMLRDYGYHRCYEYYLEIVTVLNEGSVVCHKDALEAAVALMKFYKSEKRWTDLKHMCDILWSAFVYHQREYKLELETIKLIYVTYSTLLEKHINAEFMVQRKVAMEYRDTCIKYFGASASIVVEASMAFASVCERHEKYQHEAISVYEEVIKKTSTTTSTTTTTTMTSTTTSIFQSVKSRLTKLYVSTISSAHTTTSTETVERAITLSMEMYKESKVQFGSWHERTISSLQGVLVIYKKLGTKDAHEKIVTLLREMVVEILSVEKSSWRLYTASIAIGKLFLELQIVDRGIELLDDLHGHVVAHGAGAVGKSSIKLSQHHGKATYIFLVAFELSLQKTVNIYYSEIMLNLITETMLFEQFKRVTEAKVKVEVVLLRGARLRQFLHVHRRHRQCEVVEKQIFDVFIHSYGSFLRTKKEVSFFFFVTLLEEVGRSQKEVNVSYAACMSGVAKVKILLERGDFQQAYDLACCVYQFTSGCGAYRDLKCVTLGLQFCQYLVGSLTAGVRDQKLGQQMLELSKTTVQHILDACRDSGLNFVQLPLDVLEGLVALLGNQHHYGYLEWLLQKLWSSREAQKLWPQEVIIGAGRCLVNAKFAHGHQNSHDQKDDHGHRNQAIELCEDICYNLRRARGSTDPTTLSFYELLAELFTTTQKLGQAIRTHTDVLKFIVEGEDNDDYDPDDADDDVLRPIADTHVCLLKKTCQRLKSADGKDEEIKRLVNAVAKRFRGLHIEPVTNWDLKQKLEHNDGDGLWREPARWTIKMDMSGSNKRYQPRKQVKRVISNYGLQKYGSSRKTSSMSGQFPTLSTFSREGSRQSGHASMNGSMVNGVH